MVCTVEMVSVKGRRVTAGISGEDWPGQHGNLLSLKSAVNCGPELKASGNGVTGSTGNVFISLVLIGGCMQTPVVSSFMGGESGGEQREWAQWGALAGSARGVASVKSIRRSPGSKVKAPPRSEGLLAPGDSWPLPSEF